MPTPPVGADIEAQCNKCGGPRWHVIEAKVGEEIVRVQCKECKAQHRYRNPNKAAAPKRAAGAARPRAPKAEKVVERFATPAVAADLSRAVRPYKASESYEPGERVEHPTFGQGVIEVAEPGKVTVFFAVGRKVLMQAKTAPGGGGGLSRPKPFDHSLGPGLPPPRSSTPIASAAPSDAGDDSEDGDDGDDGER